MGFSFSVLSSFVVHVKRAGYKDKVHTKGVFVFSYKENSLSVVQLLTFTTYPHHSPHHTSHLT